MSEDKENDEVDDKKLRKKKKFKVPLKDLSTSFTNGNNKFIKSRK